MFQSFDLAEGCVSSRVPPAEARSAVTERGPSAALAVVHRASGRVSLASLCRVQSGDIDAALKFYSEKYPDSQQFASPQVLVFARDFDYIVVERIQSKEEPRQIESKLAASYGRSDT
ncbi:hypothetical protein EVAR_56844_1 [Eumeta japonica]|uniref:Uncharacterized protein n=1 Tax=Eumeta variegata TaxID=151549 RepID=A0A4C1ZFH1_EUMVA|nr:hypothetical protein EVAR_56844_1 [Eumeta japonica]